MRLMSDFCCKSLALCSRLFVCSYKILKIKCQLIEKFVVKKKNFVSGKDAKKERGNFYDILPVLIIDCFAKLVCEKNYCTWME